MKKGQNIYEIIQSKFGGRNIKIELEDVRCITDTSLTIKGSRRRMTVPAEVVEILKLSNGDKLRWVVFNNGDIHIHKVKK